MPATIRLPAGLQRRLELASSTFLHPMHGAAVDFCRPVGEPALVAADSVSWRVFKNPISLFVGGVVAVILELADPAVRSGIWQRSTFRSDPLGRLRRTGLAAMVTVYGARSVAEPMIAGIVRMHSRVTGQLPDGSAYSANDPDLLTWVHVTATYGFAAAYSRYVTPLNRAEIDAVYREGGPALHLYGASAAPRSQTDATALFDARRGRLEASPIVFKFLEIMAAAPAFPRSLSWLQRLLVRAAVDLVPDWVRVRLGLTAAQSLRRRERWLVELAGALADKIVIQQGPAAQSCLRLGLPSHYLYPRDARRIV
jgi:uncharacterized protein (DUF2236 family)